MLIIFVHLGVCLLTSNLRHQFLKFLEDPSWSNHNVNPSLKVYWFLLGLRTCLNVRNLWFVGQGRVMKSLPYVIKSGALKMFENWYAHKKQTRGLNTNMQMHAQEFQ